ncbi:MAG: hypothetical protein RR394_10225 [Oscillospiraceae bacterium]
MGKVKQKTEKIFVVFEGRRYPLLDENGKYYFCEGLTVRRARTDIELIHEEVTENADS